MTGGLLSRMRPSTVSSDGSDAAVAASTSPLVPANTSLSMVIDSRLVKLSSLLGDLGVRGDLGEPRADLGESIALGDADPMTFGSSVELG